MMEKKLNELSAWVKSELDINVVVANKGSDSNSDNIFSIIIDGNYFNLTVGTSNYSLSEEQHDAIYNKLDNLNLLDKLSFCDVRMNNRNKFLLDKMPYITHLKLGKDVYNLDTSGHHYLKNIEFSLDHSSNILLPKNLNTIQVYINDDVNKNNGIGLELSNIVNTFKLTSVAFRLGELCNSFDVSHLKIKHLIQLVITTNSETDIILGSSIKQLESFDLYGVLQDRDFLTVDAKLPSTLKNIALMDCIINNSDFFSPNTTLNKLTIVNVGHKSVDINPLLSHGTLEELTITEGSVEDIDFNKAKLAQLKDLNLSHTNICNIDFISNLANIHEITVSSAELKSIPSIIPKSLTSLIVSGNKSLTELPVNISSNIPDFNASHCSVVNIPKFYLANYQTDLSQLESDIHNNLSLVGNPIENPPLEILSGSQENIQSYIDSMIGDTSILNEAKIIFVGDGSVGKTSLMKRLVHDEFDAKESQTDGIEIEPYKVDLDEEGVVNATIWDFGGQQILQATHQLFLSKRSIYVLVVEDRKNDKHKDQDIEQWLTQINSLGGRPPILVVKNKVDENPNSDIQTQKLKTKFPNIVGFFEVSCEKRIGLERLDAALTDCIRTLTMRKIALPNNWLKVKHQLKEQACSRDLLYLNTYKDICEQNGIHDRFAKDTLLRLLHDLGAVIAFEELKSHNTAILNPHWITEGIYAIIRSESLAENNGVITLEGVQMALDNYSEHNRFEDKARYILDAMRNFELCHITEETNTYLIPALLPPQINLDTAWGGLGHEECITFLFRFEHLMPPPLIPMFLVKMHSHIVGEQRWRSGAIISPSHLDARALVDADTVTREIKLTIMGEESRDLLILLRAEINALSRRLADINEIGLQELIALGDSNETIGYDELIGLKRMGKNDFPVGKLNRMFSVNKLLGEIEPPADTERALKTLMESSGNGLLNIHMTQRNENTATGGTATNHVTANNTNTNTNNNTATAEVKQDFRALKGQAEYVLDDIRYEIEGLTSSDRQLKDYATKECDRVEKAINELEANVDSQETADENLRHFSRIQNFLEGALKKTNSVGKVIDQAGDVYNEVGKLATKFNSIAEKFGIPTTVILTGLGLG
ncbi:GTP-binding protein [Vibrio gigantis]|uniref:COR domain-containing protein n=1 Tax=Vibrio gigantis TaxID=296199 RepID=UPI002FCA8291